MVGLLELDARGGRRGLHGPIRVSKLAQRHDRTVCLRAYSFIVDSLQQ